MGAWPRNNRRLTFSIEVMVHKFSMPISAAHFSCTLALYDSIFIIVYEYNHIDFIKSTNVGYHIDM